MIPCNTAKVNDGYTLVLVNRMTNESQEHSVTDVADSSLYYVFEIEFYQYLERGTYDYQLLDDERNILSRGLLQYEEMEEESVDKIYYDRERIIKIYNR